MSDLTKIFPKLHKDNYKITSPETISYNCIAWAAGDKEHWWWPDEFGLYYWPTSVPRKETLPTFQEAYQQLGYKICEDGDIEEGFEKVVLFSNEYGRPTHTALQLPSGRWTSKCGSLEDIEHELLAISESSYGFPTCYLKRARRSTNSNKK